MSELEELNEFKKQLLIFFDELISQFPLEGDLVILRLFIDNQIPIKDLMDNFIYEINKDNENLLTMVKERNENFFLNNNIFPKINKEKFNHFRKLWLSDLLDKEDKIVIWQWIDSFVFLSNRYVKTKK